MLESPPSRGRGLKHPMQANHLKQVLVASFAGAWIETFHAGGGVSGRGRLLRGGVD